MARAMPRAADGRRHGESGGRVFGASNQTRCRANDKHLREDSGLDQWTRTKRDFVTY